MTNYCEQKLTQLTLNVVHFVLNEPKSVSLSIIKKHFNLDLEIFQELIERLKLRREIRISFAIGCEDGPQGYISKIYGIPTPYSSTNRG